VVVVVVRGGLTNFGLSSRQKWKVSLGREEIILSSIPTKTLGHSDWIIHSHFFCWRLVVHVLDDPEYNLSIPEEKRMLEK
jgi:hypothetical protein